jgi:hypothetical protein
MFFKRPKSALPINAFFDQATRTRDQKIFAESYGPLTGQTQKSERGYPESSSLYEKEAEWVSSRKPGRCLRRLGRVWTTATRSGSHPASTVIHRCHGFSKKHVSAYGRHSKQCRRNDAGHPLPAHSTPLVERTPRILLSIDVASSRACPNPLKTASIT